MRVADIPPELQSPSHHYPRHATTGVGIEKYFGRYASAHATDLDSDWIYLPIYWTNNYVREKFAALPVAQYALDSLDERERYFTIVQCDDGIYEQLPSNVLVFGAGGVGDIPIPLLCDPHPIPAEVKRDHVASFLGHVECGGPEGAPGELPRSSWNPDGAGATLRRALMIAFAGRVEFHIEDRRGERFADAEAFRKMAARSHFSLAPRGYGLTSFRLYEVMGLGSIPVYIYNEPWLPYADVLDWSEFAVLCPADDIEELPERLLQISPKWRRTAVDTIARLMPDYFTKDGMCRQILRMIGERT